MQANKIKVAINRNIIDKNISGNAYFMANGWENVELTSDQFVTEIESGHAFCAQLSGVRSSANYKTTNIAAVDIDGGTTISEAMNHEFAKSHLTFLYPTVNHTAEEHRFRLVFLLEKELTLAEDQVAIKRALGLMFAGDPRTFDASRLSYGNSSARVDVFEGFIPCQKIEELIEVGKSSPITHGGSEKVGESSGASKRSSKKLQRDTEIKLKNGVFTRLFEVTENTNIHCPFHRDETPSAFVSKNDRGSTYVHCMVCQTTWWMESTKEENIRTRDDYEFVKVIKNLRTQVDANIESRNLPEMVNPKKFPELGYASINIVDKKYLELSGLHDGLTLIRSPKGSGKTESLTEIIRNLISNKEFRTLEDYEDIDFDAPPRSIHNQYKILLIGHRQALIRQLCNRLGLNCYLDDNAEMTTQEIKNRKKRYGVCLDSLWRVKEIDYDLIVIDECEQVLAHMLSDTMKNRELTYKMMRYVVASASNVVALDADLGWTSYLTLTEMRGVTTPDETNQNRVWLTINEHMEGSSEIEIYSTKNDLIGQLNTDIADGKKIFVASNSKRLIDRLHAAIEKEHGIGKSFAVTSANSRSDEVQVEILDFKETFKKYDVVMCSPSLGTGIDITFEGQAQVVDCCYGFFDSLINTHLDIDQQIRRVRHPKKVRVWLSPRRFQFETEFGVIKRQLLADKVIANTFIGFDPTSRQEIYNEADPFLTLATHVVSDERLSMNNLKNNFIDYKVKAGWKPIHIESNSEIIDIGKKIIKLGKRLDDEAYSNHILAAKPIDKSTYETIKNSLEDDTRVREEDYWSYIRMNLELFYQSAVTNEIIKIDNRGSRRSELKYFKAVTSKDEIERINHEIQAKFKSGKTIPFDRIKDRDAKTALLHTLLSSSPLLNETTFDLSCVYSTEDLSEFVRTCKKLKHFVEAQFNEPIRADISTKPTQQLHRLLKNIGIRTINENKKVGGEKIYMYMLDPNSYNSMVELRTLRESVQDDWIVINQLHGFTSTQPTI